MNFKKLLVATKLLAFVARNEIRKMNVAVIMNVTEYEAIKNAEKILFEKRLKRFFLNSHKYPFPRNLRLTRSKKFISIDLDGEKNINMFFSLNKKRFIVVFVANLVC